MGYRNKEFSPEEIRMAEKHLKKCSTLLVIREMQIKTTLRFHLTPVRMAKVKNSGDIRCWWVCGERGTLLHCCWGCKMVQPLRKSVWRFLRKLDVTTSGGPCYTSPGHISRWFPGMQQRHMLHCVHSSLIYNSQKLERTQMSLKGGMDTENVVYLHNGILLSN